MRLCCGCHQRREQRELIRLQIDSFGSLQPVHSHNKGRSAWVCFNVHCIQAIIRHPKKLFRSLRTHSNTQHLNKTLTHWLWLEICHNLLTMNGDGCLIKSPHPDSYTIYTTTPHGDLATHFTSEPKFLSTQSENSAEHYTIFTAPHKKLGTLKRNIQLYESLYKNGIENITS